MRPGGGRPSSTAALVETSALKSRIMTDGIPRTTVGERRDVGVMSWERRGCRISPAWKEIATCGATDDLLWKALSFQLGTLLVLGRDPTHIRIFKLSNK